MTGRYGSYLPSTLEDYQNFDTLDELESPILEEAYMAKEQFVKNQWIETADRSGLQHFAFIMGIIQNFTDVELEELRDYMLACWNSKAPYTYLHLKEWVYEYCGGSENCEIILTPNLYHLAVTLKLGVKEKKEAIYERLREITPANIRIDMDLFYNTHRMVGQFTHGQLKQYEFQYGNLAEEDLELYFS